MSYFTIKANEVVAWVNGSQDGLLVTKLEELDYANVRSKSLVRGIAFVLVGEPLLCMTEFPISGGSIQGDTVRCKSLEITGKLVKGMTPEEAAKYVAPGSWEGTEAMKEFREAGMTEKDLSIVVKVFARMVLSCISLNFKGLTEVSKKIAEED